MARELFTIRGETDGVSTSGDCPLRSDLIYESTAHPAPTRVVLPKGMKAKVWAKRITGDGATTFTILYSRDALGLTKPWTAVSEEVLAAAGEISLEKRRPIVMRSIAGTEGFKVSWSQRTPARAAIELEVEITDEE